MKNFFKNLRDKLIESKADKLVRKLLSMEQEISPWVIENLPQYEEKDITFALQEAFPNLESHMQQKLIFYLEEIGYIDMLIEKLTKGSEEEILFSLSMLSILKPLRALKYVVNRLSDNREHIRFEVADTLIAYRHKRVVELMVNELREDSPYLPARIAQVLVGYGPLASVILIDNMDNPDLKTDLIIEILEQMERNERVLDKVISHLSNEDAKVRTAAVKYLANNCKEEFFDHFRNAVFDEAPSVRIQAIKGLKKINSKEARKFLEQLDHEEDPVVQLFIKNSIREVAVTKEGETK